MENHHFQPRMQLGSYFSMCAVCLAHNTCILRTCCVISGSKIGEAKATPAHTISKKTPVLPHPLKMPYLSWPRMQAWSRVWSQRGLEHADNPERKTRALRIRCPGLPRQPSWCSPGSRPPAAASVESPAGLRPWWLGGWRRARTQLGQQLQLRTLASAPPFALEASCCGNLAAPTLTAVGEWLGALLETAELRSPSLRGLLQREEQPLRLTLTLLPGPLVSSWETLLENHTLWHHTPK